MARLMAVDADNTAWLKGVIDQSGWPEQSMVGDEAARAAWLLAQHADRDPAAQRRFLQCLEAAVARPPISRASPIGCCWRAARSRSAARNWRLMRDNKSRRS
jgi:hypothetical protein